MTMSTKDGDIVECKILLQFRFFIFSVGCGLQLLECGSGFVVMIL